MVKKSDPGQATLANIFELQEAALVNRVQAVRSTKKGELIGADLEAAISAALTTLLPESIRFVGGFVVKPDGRLSSHFDGLLVDSRYPILASVAGSALIPIHALLGAVELKTNLTGRELDNALAKGRELASLGVELRRSLEREKRDQEKWIKKERSEAAKARDGKKVDVAEQQLAKVQKMLTNPKLPIFGALALASDISEIGIATRLWKTKSEAHLMVLRPTEEKRPRPLPTGMRILRMGSLGPAKHFWLEQFREPCIRGTRFGFGFFLLQILIQEAGSVLAGRDFSASEIDGHLNIYCSLLIDIA